MNSTSYKVGKLSDTNHYTIIRLVVVVLIAILNFIYGFLFHVSRGNICYTELFVFVTSSALFWVLVIDPINWISRYLLLNKKWSNHFKGMIFFLCTLSVITINLLFSQVCVLLIIGYVMHLQPQADSIVIATLSNSTIGNLFCFLALSGIAIYEHRIKNSIATSPVINAIEKTHNKFLMVSHGKALVKIKYSDIISIESHQNSISIHTDNYKLVKYKSLKTFLEECPYPNLKRIHRSFAINTDFISSIETNKNGDGLVFLKCGSKFKMSRTYKKDIKI